MNNNFITGYDSTTPSKSIPPTAQVVFPYKDGKFKWDASVLFPHTKVKTITVFGDLEADIADCERFDLTVQDAINWAKAKWKDRLEAGTVYTQKSQIPELANGLMGTPHFFFIADPGEYHMYAGVSGVVATQYLNDPYHNLDTSVVSLDWINNIATPNWSNKEGVKDVDVLMNDGKTWYTVSNNAKHAIVSGAEGSALAATLPVVKEPVPQYLASIPTV